MSKVFKLLILISLYFLSFYSVDAVINDEINIISRQQWGAEESFRYLDSPEWKKAIKKMKSTPKKELSEYRKTIATIKAKKVKKANNYIIDNHSDIF
jgi:hypothetical protein